MGLEPWVGNGWQDGICGVCLRVGSIPTSCLAAARNLSNFCLVVWFEVTLMMPCALC
jgi:hypothetical protein